LRNEPKKAHKMARVVIDTNVLVSAFLKRGRSRNLLFKLLEKHTVVLSSQMLAELTDVLSREKFNVTSAQIDRFISVLVRQAIVVPLSSNLKIVLEDPDDDMVLNTALSGAADYIVSGDKHLLTIACYKSVKILSINELSLKLFPKKDEIQEDGN
jgi:putative PIN family toxin of toxin-antitoxin system